MSTLEQSIAAEHKTIGAVTISDELIHQAASITNVRSLTLFVKNNPQLKTFKVIIDALYKPFFDVCFPGVSVSQSETYAFAFARLYLKLRKRISRRGDADVEYTNLMKESLQSEDIDDLSLPKSLKELIDEERECAITLKPIIREDGVIVITSNPEDAPEIATISYYRTRKDFDSAWTAAGGCCPITRKKEFKLRELSSLSKPEYSSLLASNGVLQEGALGQTREDSFARMLFEMQPPITREVNTRLNLFYEAIFELFQPFNNYSDVGSLMLKQVLGLFVVGTFISGFFLAVAEAFIVTAAIQCCFNSISEALGTLKIAGYLLLLGLSIVGEAVVTAPQLITRPISTAWCSLFSGREKQDEVEDEALLDVPQLPFS